MLSSEKVLSSRESKSIYSIGLYALEPKEWNCVNSGTGIQNTFQTDVTGIFITAQLVALDWISKFISGLLNPSMTCKSAQ